VMAARLAALLGWTANFNQDRVGGFVFTDDWHSEIRPQSGRRGLMNFFRGIVDAQMHASSGDRGQFSDTLSRLRAVVHGGSTVIILSDFVGFNEKAKLAMGNLLQRLDILAVHIVDPIECELPESGRYAIKGSQTQGDQLLSIDTSRRAQAQRYLEDQVNHQQRVSEFFSSHGHLYVKALTNQPLLDVASRIMSRIPDKVTQRAERSTN